MTQSLSWVMKKSEGSQHWMPCNWWTALWLLCPFIKCCLFFCFISCCRLWHSIWLPQAERLPVPGGYGGGQGSRLLQGLHLPLHRYHGCTQHGCLQGQPIFRINNYAGWASPCHPHIHYMKQLKHRYCRCRPVIVTFVYCTYACTNGWLCWWAM